MFWCSRGLKLPSDSCDGLALLVVMKPSERILAIAARMRSIRCALAYFTNSTSLSRHSLVKKAPPGCTAADRAPSLARYRLDPVAALDAGRLFRDRSRRSSTRPRSPRPRGIGYVWLPARGNPPAASAALNASGCRDEFNDQNSSAGILGGSVTL